MKTKNPISLVGTILLILLCNYTQAQPTGILASGVYISDCNQSNFFNTSGNPADVPGPAANVFQNANLGVHTQNSNALILRGAQVKTFKNPASSNVCSARMFYRIYLQSGVPGAFSSIDLPLLESCNGGTGTYPSGGSCTDGDQKWERVIPDGTTTPFAPVDLTTRPPGNYVLEVYYETSGSFTATTGCTDIVTLNNGGAFYRATFSIQLPNLSSTNPSSCFGNEGSITIAGLVPGATYSLTYADDGSPVPAANYTANASGQIIITNLNKGFYTNFILAINGCTTPLFTGIILSDPIFVPTFPAIAPFCSGTATPTLPATSTNGIGGTWSPSTVNNTTTGTYTFTANAGTCGITTTITVTVIPRVTPTFAFGTALTVCSGGTVPSLPNTSTNGINGTWSPSTVSNTAPGVYTFTPTAGSCTNPATFTVNITPNVTPTFTFGTSANICSGGGVPSLPTTSTNGITGTWSPATVSNTASGSYTFTPGAGQPCAIPITYSVTVNPIVSPTFSFGPTANVCNGGTAPSLPTTSTNGINGTWSPSTVSTTASGAYTFTPAAGQCTTPFTLNVTVNPNITPTFGFGTGLGICAGGVVPSLPNTSNNSITGTWSPSTVSNTTSGTYTFTPTAGQCAVPATFTVTVNPLITPVFSFGPSVNICSGGAAPTLPTTSTNGINGTWSPSTVSNTSTGTYTFTPNPGQCVTAAPVTVTVNVGANTVPIFSFGSSLTICAGGAVPTLPTLSDNGVGGTWTPSTVSNTASGNYVFSPATGQCATQITYSVTINPILTPAFPFGTFQSICIGTAVPTLTNTSTNGVTGTWSPTTVDNMANGVYTFTPNPGQCTNSTTFTLEVNTMPATGTRNDTTVYDGAVIPQYNFTVTPAGVIHWTNTNPTIGLAATGVGNIPSFTATNMGVDPSIATINVTPMAGGCAGPSTSYKITVLPLNKDVFVPNVFSPNGDGKNDILYIYGNYISKVDMRIFNQWGQQIASITNKANGWDGRHKGNPQPVGVYVYTAKVELVNGKTITLKGSITLVR
jgi:gliding motility-associated-like protein